VKEQPDKMSEVDILFRIQNCYYLKHVMHKAIHKLFEMIFENLQQRTYKIGKPSNINNEILADYLNLPMFLAKRILFSFASSPCGDINKINKAQFIEGMFNLYFGSSLQISYIVDRIYENNFEENEGAKLIDNFICNYQGKLFINQSDDVDHKFYLLKFIYDRKPFTERVIKFASKYFYFTNNQIDNLSDKDNITKKRISKRLKLEEKVIKVRKICDDNVISKFKLVLIDNHLFTFKKITSSHGKNYQLESITLLKGLYITSALDLKTSLEKPFYCSAILQSFNKISINKNQIYIFVTKEENENFLSLIRHALNFRDINKDYQFLDVAIGQGSFSKVVLALNKITQAKVAIKKICKDQITFFQSSFIRNEIEVTKFLMKKENFHENILNYYDVYEDDFYIYIVMEYISTGNLEDLISSVCLTQKEVNKICREVAEGINFLHNKGIIHRDLKPENILILKQKVMKDNRFCFVYKPKIADFGFSKFSFGVSCNYQEKCGSLIYSAPEIVTFKNQNYSNKVDVWSFGITLFYLIFGYPPYYKENLTDEQIIDRIINDRFSVEMHLAKNKIDLDLSELILGCLKKNQFQRKNISQVVNSSWFKEKL
jgi:hypothetical protein